MKNKEIIKELIEALTHLGYLDSSLNEKGEDMIKDLIKKLRKEDREKKRDNELINALASGIIPEPTKEEGLTLIKRRCFTCLTNYSFQN
jgi:hypothetical protein